MTTIAKLDPKEAAAQARVAADKERIARVASEARLAARVDRQMALRNPESARRWMWQHLAHNATVPAEIYQRATGAGHQSELASVKAEVLAEMDMSRLERKNERMNETQAELETLINASHAEAMNASRILYKEMQELKEMLTQLLMAQASQPAVAASTDAQAGGSFSAETLSATVDAGKVYWKVKGGSFQKFGVTVWPEALAASGIDPDALNPLNVVDLKGYTAFYDVKEDGKPSKVTRLVKK